MRTLDDAEAVLRPTMPAAACASTSSAAGCANTAGRDGRGRTRFLAAWDLARADRRGRARRRCGAHARHRRAARRGAGNGTSARWSSPAAPRSRRAALGRLAREQHGLGAPRPRRRRTRSTRFELFTAAPSPRAASRAGSRAGRWHAASARAVASRGAVEQRSSARRLGETDGYVSRRSPSACSSSAAARGALGVTTRIRVHVTSRRIRRVAFSRASAAANLESVLQSRCELHDPHAHRATERHGHVPLHRHRGVDAAAPCGRTGGLRRGARRAPARAARGFDSPRRRRGRHPGRRVLRRLPDRAGRGRSGRSPGSERSSGPDPSANGAAHGHADRDGRGYVGVDVHRGARVAALAHGGQVLVTEATAALLDGSGAADLGQHPLKDFDGPVRLYQLGDDRVPAAADPGAIDLPNPATAFLGRERELSRAVTSGTSATAGPHGRRAGRDRQDALRDRAGAPPRRGGRRGDRLRAARPAAGPGARPARRRRRSSAPRPPTPRRSRPRVGDTSDASRPRQPRAASPGGRPHVRRARSPRRRRCGSIVDEPRAAANPGRSRARPSAAGRGRRSRAVPRPRARRTSVRADDTKAIARLCAASIACRSRSSSPPRGRSSSPRSSSSIVSVSDSTSSRGTRDAEERHATLRATIAWSARPARRAEQALFATPAVFRCGCTLETAEAVCDADLDMLASLLDKSLSAVERRRRRDRAVLDARDDPRVRSGAAREAGESDELARAPRTADAGGRAKRGTRRTTT